MRTRRVLNLKFFLILLATLGILGTAIHFVHGFQVERNAKVLYDQALVLEKEGQAQEAITILSQFIGLKPGKEGDEGLAKLAVLRDEEANALGQNDYEPWLSKTWKPSSSGNPSARNGAARSTWPWTCTNSPRPSLTSIGCSKRWTGSTRTS